MSISDASQKRFSHLRFCEASLINGSYNTLMNSLPLKDEHITLARALKASGLADTGGQAKNLIRSGVVHVNDVPETQPGRKLMAGDRFQILDGAEWIIVR